MHILIYFLIVCIWNWGLISLERLRRSLAEQGFGKEKIFVLITAGDKGYADILTDLRSKDMVIGLIYYVGSQSAELIQLPKFALPWSGITPIGR